MTSVATANGEDISIPVQKVVHSESSKEYQATTSSISQGDPEKDAKDLDQKMKEMEEEMEKIRKDLEDPKDVAPDGFVVGDRINGADPHHLKTTKILRSYEKTTKRTEEKRNLSKDLVADGQQPREVLTTQHHIKFLPANVAQIKPAAAGAGLGQKEVTTTIYESPSVTIKTISREGTPQRQKEVVIVREEGGDDLGRTSLSPGRQRIIISPGRERITVSPGRLSQTSTTTSTGSDETSRKEIKKTSQSSTYTSHSTKKSTSTSSNRAAQPTALGGGGGGEEDSSPFKEDPFFKDQAGTSHVIPKAHHNGVVDDDSAHFDWDGWMEKQKTNNSKLVQFDIKDGKKHLKLRYEISPKDYDPSDISVKVTTENKVLIRAEHKETGPSRSVWRECTKEFLVPKGVDLAAITSSFSPEEGILTVDIPLPVQA